MRIAFLHPYKMRDHFFVEVIESATIADLRARGHEAEAVDFVFEPARDEATQVREMHEALLAQQYDLVFLERPWSDEMVRALTGIRLVAYGRDEMVTQGLVEVAVAPSRRAVRGLVDAIAAGAPLEGLPGVLTRNAEGTTARRDEGGALGTVREVMDASFDHLHRRVLSRSGANEDRAVVVANFGCAYRNVPNRTGTFDGVYLPPGVSTAGCTFCDVTAYERMTEAEAVALIVRQVKAVLRDRPHVTQIAIKDDYALRYLGALGEALTPLGLGDREVLFSARGDYLLEFQREIEAALAGAFPTRIGFYLIGFENFSQPELDRFNKGVSSAQIERFITLMREWSQRFPDRFHVTPTGGFILFTPWTTLNDLRTNADAIRRLGFEDFRGRALLSQVRLYPNLPLYWLAKRDGLLVDAFERDDMSDARRRGYEVDHGWRFRDAKVDQVYKCLLDASSSGASERLLDVLDDALDDASGVARGKKNRPARLVLAPQDRKTGGPSTEQLLLNRSCTQACGFCNVRGPERESPRMRAARAIHTVKEAARAGRRTVVISGAEPTLEWYLADLVRLARDLGIGDVVLETNGTTLGADGQARALADAGVTRAVVSLNTLDPKASDAITRDVGGFERTRAGIVALLDAGVPVDLATAVLPQDLGALVDVVQRANTLFASRQAKIESVIARYLPDSGVDPRDAARALTAAAEASRVAGVTLRVAPGGELPPCVFDDASTAPEVMRLGEVFVARDTTSHQRIPACATCSLTKVCPGPPRASAARVAARAKPVLEEGAALATVTSATDVRTRVLREYRSQFYVPTPHGEARERRIVRVNFHCNQACDFCFVSRELPAIDHDTIVREIHEVAARGAILDLSGGEPTLNPRITEYIRLARSLGVEELELQTNAINMANPEVARALAEAGLPQAFVSLHGVTAAVCDRVTAAPGTFVKTVAGIKNLLANGVRVRLNWVLCGYNVDELALLPDFVHREFVEPFPGAALDINFSYVAASTDNVPRDSRLIPRFSEVAWALDAAFERALALGIVFTGFDSKCGVPACYLPARVRAEHFAGDIAAEELSRHSAGFTKSEACAQCSLDARCYGIRTSYAEMHGVSELRPVHGDGTVTAPTRSQDPVWREIEIAPTHVLREETQHELSNDAAFAPHRDGWAQRFSRWSDHEIVQLEGGLRRLVKRERRSEEEAERTASAMRERGFEARVYIGPPGPGGAARRAIAFIAREASVIDRAFELEARLTEAARTRLPLVLEMGDLLGYPTCCVKAFASASDQDDRTHIARLAGAHPGVIGPESNWAAMTLRPFSHFPCTPACTATAELGRRTIDRIRARDPNVADALLHALSSVVVTQTVERFALLLDARPDGPQAWRYDGVLSPRNLGIDNGPLARRSFRAFYLEVIAPLEQGDRVVRTPASLVVERAGRRIARVEFAPTAPRLLDFTGRTRRVLPVLASHEP